jgi:uncharacterized membrane protein
MTTLAVRFYDIVVAVHVLAVVVAFGSTFAYPLMDVAARRGHLGDLPSMHRFQLFLLRALVTPGMVVVLAAGVYLASDAANGYDFGTSWVSATFVILIVLFGLVGAVFTPAQRRLVALAERDLAAGDGRLSEEYEREARLMNVLGSVAGLLIAVAIYLMVVKPGGA